MSLYRTSVNKPVTVALIFITVAILGVFSLMRLSTNLFPDMGENTIIVVTSYSGASAADIETNVTKPLENSLNSVSNLKHMSTTSKENISVISLEFEYGIDIAEATNDVRDKLDIATQALPDAVSTPTIFKFSMEDMPIMLMSATAEESLNGLDKILDDKVATPLARVNGVGTISVSGAPKREIQVYVDPDKLAAYGITVESISSTLAYENRNTPAGTIDIGSNTYSVRIEKEFKSAEEMLNVIVGSYNNAPIYLKDVATVNDGEQERLQKVFSNGQQGAMLTIQKQTDANTVQVIKGIKKELKKIQKDLPSDVQLNIIIDGSINIIDTINSLKDTIMITFLVVMSTYVFGFTKFHANQVSAAVMAFAYAPVCLSFIYATRELEFGIYLVWLILICSWGCDTCAYCVGVLFGKHKMAPILSPKKSIEGAVGGVVGAAGLGALYGWFVNTKVEASVNFIILFAIICAVGALISMVGDLAASAIKRNYDVKDYGKLIPGHGGVMDRFDSVIFAAPIIYFLAKMFI